MSSLHEITTHMPGGPVFRPIAPGTNNKQRVVLEMTKQSETQNYESRIAELEAQVAALQAAAAPKPVAPKPPQRENRPVTIVSLTPVASADAMPDAEQFVELQRIVLEKFPRLAPNGERGQTPDEFHAQFQRAFKWLMVTGRLERDRVDTSCFLVDWVDKAKRYNRNEDIGVKAFLCAALAVGDCTIYSNFGNLPFDTSLGLRDFYGSRADSAAGWKRVLAGEMLMPVAPPRQSSPVHISFR